MPMFSIIMPCFNAADTLAETLESLQRQSDADWELICINDQSTDHTLRMLRKYAQNDNRLRVISPMKSGPAIARNLGASLAKGKILCFCDADDIWEPGKLAQLRVAFADQQVDAVYGQVLFFSQAGQIETKSTVPEAPLTVSDLMAENPVCTMSNISVRKTRFVHCGGFNPHLVHNEDLEWLVQLVGGGANVVGLDMPQVWYRTVITGLSADLSAMASSRQAVLQAAAGFGHIPTRAHEARYFRYLARRALRLDLGRRQALRFAALGLLQNPNAFLNPLHRGVGTALGALAAVFLPRAARLALFSR